jgi:putative transposase
MLMPMSRRARGHLDAGTYHVTLRSAGPVAMFVDDVDRYDFCGRVSRTIDKLGWICRAFCLMSTHYHLLLDVEANSLQVGMHRINGQYAQEFNKRHGRSGHLCGERYNAEPVTTDAHMLGAFRYILRNPVRAGLCTTPADWTWSSYRGSAGLDSGFRFVNDSPMHAYFGADANEIRRNVRALVDDS